MGKIAALDLGDRWVGVALSDVTKTLARPHNTISAAELLPYIALLQKTENLEALVIGYPKTLKGTISQQTQKVLERHETLKKTFPTLTCILWDERFTSKQAAQLGSTKTKEEKLKSHARAAAFILDSYLLFRMQHEHRQENSSD